jgi:predicted dehydrogenase
MKTWGFGIIGAGLIGKVHAKAIAALPNARLTAVCDNIPERAKALADEYGAKAYTDYGELVADRNVDVVTIGTPSGLHLGPSVAAAQAGKHVLTEKPMEISLSRIDSMIEAHAKAGTRLGGIFPLRFTPLYLPLLNAVRTQRFGIITCASVHVPWWRTADYYRTSWRGTWTMDGGGAVMNQTIHLIDLLCWMLPPVESIQAYTATRVHPIETEDVAVAICRFAGGALGMVHGSTSSYPGQGTRIEITGSRGTAIVQHNGISTWSFETELPEDADIRTQWAIQDTTTGPSSNPADLLPWRHSANFSAFLDALESGTPFSIEGAEARKSVAFITALYEAAARSAAPH